MSRRPTVPLASGSRLTHVLNIGMLAGGYRQHSPTKKRNYDQTVLDDLKRQLAELYQAVMSSHRIDEKTYGGGKILVRQSLVDLELDDEVIGQLDTMNYFVALLDNPPVPRVIWSTFKERVERFPYKVRANVHETLEALEAADSAGWVAE